MQAGARTRIAGALLAGLLIGGGVALAGWFVADAYLAARRSGGEVTVKGLAEREVAADLAIWPIHLSATGDDLGQAQARVDADRERLIAFLNQAGFGPQAIEAQRPRVTDLLAQAYRSEQARESRFIVVQTVLLRSERVDLVDAVSRRSRELLRQGVLLTDTPAGGGLPGPAGPRYVFTGLNDIKPGMLQEATAAARDAARKFANDSHSVLGPIRRANQGIFQILPRDGLDGVPEWTQRFKKVRVVSTVRYRLLH